MQSQLGRGGGRGAANPGAAVAPAVIAPGGQGQPPPHVPAYWIQVSANQDGSFTVTNTRNGFSKTYPARN